MKTSILSDILPMSSKGTLTLPIEIRKDMNLVGDDVSLVVTYNPETKQAILSRPEDFSEIQARVSKYAKGKKPLTDVDAFYQKSKKALK
jgi:bifunctional DNA-binding transcriptional regulator/antitoxin component of YhaV-PrlF toxin-antitoxin module